MEQGYQESLLENKEEDNNKETGDVDDRIPLTKDLTTIIEKITKTKGSYGSCDEPQIALQKIPNSSVAVFQNIEPSEEKQVDDMRNQVCHLNVIHIILNLCYK